MTEGGNRGGLVETMETLDKYFEDRRLRKGEKFVIERESQIIRVDFYQK